MLNFETPFGNVLEFTPSIKQGAVDVSDSECSLSFLFFKDIYWRLELMHTCSDAAEL